MEGAFQFEFLDRFLYGGPDSDAEPKMEPPISNDKLNSLVGHYRRLLSEAGRSPRRPAGGAYELEARFARIDAAIAQTVLEGLVAKKVPVDDGAISQSVSAISQKAPSRGRDERKTSLVRQVTFADGVKAGENNYQKTSLEAPVVIKNPHALDCRIHLSEERPVLPVNSDSSAVLRVKCRASFLMRAPADAAQPSWRVDLTVVRELSGRGASSLRQVTREMFPAAPMTPANMLDLLGVADAGSPKRGLYKYELEIEHVGGDDERLPTTLREAVGAILRLARPEYIQDALYQAEVFHVAKFVVKDAGYLQKFEYELGMKRLAPQVVALSRTQYQQIYPPTGYYLLDKADGLRALASVRNGCLRLLAGGALTEMLYAAPPNQPAPERVTRATILDGELVETAEGPVFYAFDLVAKLGQNFADRGYGRRLKELAEGVGILRDFGLDARAKPVVHLTGTEPADLEAQFAAPAAPAYGTDGRILVQPGQSYLETNTFKWKPLADTTIDFLARRAPPEVLGRPEFAQRPGHRLYFLFVGINSALFRQLRLERVDCYSKLFPRGPGGGDALPGYFPVQFSPADAPLAFVYHHPAEAPAGFAGDYPDDPDGLVLEMRCASGCAAAGGLVALPDWELVRVRTDRSRDLRTQRYFGNDFRVAEDTWLNYVDLFPERMLWEGPLQGYFAAPKPAMYAAQTAFTSFVKSRRIKESLSHAPWVIDAGIGKGQDLARYADAGVQSLLGIDGDRGALSELARRHFGSKGRARKKIGQGGGSAGIRLYILRADLKAAHAETSKKIHDLPAFPEKGAAALVSNLAIHYLTGSSRELANFAAFARETVKPEGLVVITAMLGEKVHAFLEAQGVKKGQSWDHRQDGVLKYSIRRDYSGNSLTQFGQQVGVLLPFSRGEYYPEFLVNIDALVETFASRGFVLKHRGEFSDLFETFRSRNPQVYGQLTEGDFEYLGLYGEVILQREADADAGGKPKKRAAKKA